MDRSSQHVAAAWRRMQARCECRSGVGRRPDFVPRGRMPRELRDASLPANGGAGGWPARASRHLAWRARLSRLTTGAARYSSSDLSAVPIRARSPSSSRLSATHESTSSLRWMRSDALAHRVAAEQLPLGDLAAAEAVHHAQRRETSSAPFRLRARRGGLQPRASWRRRSHTWPRTPSAAPPTDVPRRPKHSRGQVRTASAGTGGCPSERCPKGWVGRCRRERGGRYACTEHPCGAPRMVLACPPGGRCRAPL